MQYHKSQVFHSSAFAFCLYSFWNYCCQRLCLLYNIDCRLQKHPNNRMTHNIIIFLYTCSFRSYWKVYDFGKWAELYYKSVTYPPFACGSGYLISKPIVKYLSNNIDSLQVYQVHNNGGLGHADIGIIFSFIENSQWCLYQGFLKILAYTTLSLIWLAVQHPVKSTARWLVYIGN